MSMKKTLLILGALALTGCSSTQFKWGNYGTPDGLPCIQCGEDFQFIPNEPMAAIRQSKRIYGFKWGDPSRAPVY